MVRLRPGPGVRRRVVGVALLATILGACGTGTPDGDAGGAGAGGGPVTVTLLTFGSPDELAVYRSLADGFSAANPDVRVRVLEAADRADLATRLSTAFAGGDPPDLFLVNYRLFPQYAARGVLDPVGPRLDRSERLAADDFYAEALDAFRWDGVLTCMPQNISSLAVYYNVDQFEQAGLPLPTNGWTWDDMLVAAKALTGPDADGDGLRDQHGLGVDPEFVRLAPFVWSAGGDVFDDDDDPTRITMDDPAAQLALADFMDLWWTHDVVPSELEYEAEDNEARFANGRMAMVMGSRRSVPYFRTITGFRWDVAPLPVRATPVSLLHSDAYCLPATGAHRDEAWRFVEYAVGADGAAAVAASGRTVPSLREAAESDVFLDPVRSPASSQVFLDAIPTLRAVPTVSTWPEIEDTADLVLEVALWRERKRPDQVAAELQAATADAFDRAER